MKRIIPFFLIIFFASGVFAQIGTLTVTVLSSEAGTGLTEIEYEFTGDAGNYDILVEVDFDDGEGFRTIDIDHFSGDWKNVTPGDGPYFISWDGRASFPETYSEETVIRLTANFCELPDAPVADDATGITTNSFTANWEAVTGAVTYTLDVALDEGFATFVEGYQNLDVEANTSYIVGGLSPTTSYYYRIKVTDDCGTSGYSGTVSVTTLTPPFSCGDDDITFSYRGLTVTYGTIERGGLCWMDRNLGASRVPESSTDSEGFGDLFQWGRLDDGHQDRESTVVQTQSNTDDPGHNQFIGYDPNSFPVRDWRNPQNDALWQGEDGINNPCPPGWRVPTETELDEERASWGGSNQNADGAYASTLKWPTGGLRYDNGPYSGGRGNVWSSSVSSESARYLRFRPKSYHWPEGEATIATTRRGGGKSVRCVKSLDE